ncbi:MAG: hypothetical protein HF300_05950 [Ignavibacteria bacterium]|nr:hypothetical protein [Ignavibacteria bacterium]MCU7498724.1 hypothetical protein [Ignavibacteria bacterium]MCU7512081.1 hypothetical protein [Ignavibacteria bacterium]MCU7520614.1 hypothetical protein [Ignavibacteria bacterium]MCU7523512.1 hypothetical protein [Ignavibacteria bacterium]
MAGCVNPFAPALDENLNTGSSPVADQSKVEGVFQNMQYAYTMRDTTIYGQLLSPDFTFTYRDYDKGFDVTWGRDDEMRATYGLFQNSKRLDLIWNNILLISGDSTSIVRSFNLTITFSPTDVQSADGKVSLTLKKNPSTKFWQIQRWVDESSF